MQWSYCRIWITCVHVDRLLIIISPVLTKLHYTKHAQTNTMQYLLLLHKYDTVSLYPDLTYNPLII